MAYAAMQIEKWTKEYILNAAERLKNGIATKVADLQTRWVVPSNSLIFAMVFPA